MPGTFAELRELLDRALTHGPRQRRIPGQRGCRHRSRRGGAVAAWDNRILLGERAYSLEEWPRFDETLPDVLKTKAGQALNRVLRLGEDNELFLLWDEAGEWDQVVTDIGRYRTALP